MEAKLRVCFSCGNPFQATRPGKLYCSQTCRNRYHNRNRKYAHQKTINELRERIALLEREREERTK